MKKTTVIYCRVSSDKQREDETIQDQLEKNRASCEKRGSKILKEFADDGWTGATLQRPDITSLRKLAKEGKFTEIQITNLSRLARDAIKQGVLVEELRRNGVEIFVGNDVLADTKEGKFLITALGAAHELQKEMIIENTVAGRWRSARKKKLIQATAPFGLRFERDEKDNYVRAADGGKIVEKDEKESETIKLIFSLYLELQSPYLVAKELLKREIKTRQGGCWSENYIRDILQNRVYIGDWYYGKRQSVEPKKRKGEYIRIKNSSARIRDKKEWIEFKVPAIIDEETFYKAQEIFERKRRVKHNLKREYLLNGLVYCGECGGRMYGTRQVWKSKGKIIKDYFYYTCGNKTKLGKNGKPRCNSLAVREEVLNEDIWNKIAELFDRPKEVFAAAKYLNDKENNDSILKRQKQGLIKRKEFIKESKNKLLELYEIGDMDLDLLKERMNQHQENEKDIDLQLKEIETSFQQLARKNDILKAAQSLSGRIGKEIKKFTPDEKVRFLNTFMDKIIYSNPNQIEMIGRFPVLEGIKSAEPLVVSTRLLRYLNLKGKESLIPFRLRFATSV